MDSGHNSNGQLKAIVERIEAVEADMKDRMEDRKEIYLEAKSQGYDLPALRAIIRLRKQNAEKLAQQEAIQDTYKQALGMI
jgi:uncharacterized protein (UPF0335 family)